MINLTYVWQNFSRRMHLAEHVEAVHSAIKASSLTKEGRFMRQVDQLLEEGRKGQQSVSDDTSSETLPQAPLFPIIVDVPETFESTSSMKLIDVEPALR